MLTSRESPHRVGGWTAPQLVQRNRGFLTHHRPWAEMVHLIEMLFSLQ